MSLETQILELLERWQALRQEGKILTPEELCADYPECLEEVKDRLHHLLAFDQFLGLGPSNPEDRSALNLSRKTGTGDPHQTVDSDRPGEQPATGLPRVNGFEILEPLGRGGMGQVFMARQTHLDRLVALKIIRPDRLINPDNVRRFQREARATARLAHPNIVTLYDAGQDGATHYLAMEYVEGTDLAHLVQERGPLPIAEACDYVRQAALGLQHAFERGLVHRDIKPSNLLRVASDGKIKVLDLGLARLVEAGGPAEDSSSALTEVGVLMGTADYMAPEQASDARKADIRADLYSLGCTLFFLLTGRPPFPDGSFTDKVVRHATEEPMPLQRLRPEVSPDVCAIVQRLLAKNPKERYQTPAELAVALEPRSHSTPTSQAIGARSEHPAASSSMGTSVVALARAVPRLAMRLQFGRAGCSFTLMSLLVLLAGASMTALTVYVSLNRAHPPTVHLGVTDEDVLGQIASKQFPRALVNIEDGTFGAANKEELRDKVLRAWLEDVRSLLEKRDAKGALAQANSILEHFPGNQEALMIASQADLQRRIPPPKNQEQVARETLERATASLGSDPNKALDLFGEVAKMPVSAELKTRAKLGQARAYFRLGNSDEARKSLPNIKLDAKDGALQSALHLWVQAPKGVNDETDPGLLKTLAAELVQLKPQQDYLGGEAEGVWSKSLEAQITQELPQRLATIAAEAPKKDQAQILRGFEQLKAIGSAYAQFQSVFEKDRRLAKEKLWGAAKGMRKHPNPFQQPWEKDDMRLVLDWLQTAQALMNMEPHKDLELPIRKELALASWYSQKREGVAKLLEDLPNEPKPEELPYLFVKGKSQLDDEAKFDVNYGIVEGLKDGTRFQTDFFEEVLQPAINAGIQVVRRNPAPALKRRLADCYLVKAKFIKGSPALVERDWELEYMKCYEAAFAYGKAADIGLELSRIHRRWALKLKDARDQREYLEKAQRDLGAEAPDPKIADLVHQQRGLIHEDFASLFKEQKEFDKAVGEFSKAIRLNPQQGKYLLDRGRCYQEQALGSSAERKAALADLAQKDLGNALVQFDAALKKAGTGTDEAAQKAVRSLKSQMSEAHYWLGAVVSTKPNPDYSQGRREFDRALQLAEELGDEGKPFHGTAVLYLYNIVQALTRPSALAKATNRDALDAPIAACKSLRQYGPKFGGQFAEICETFAANSLATIGKVANDKKLCPLGEIFQILNDGLGQGAQGNLNGLKPGYLGLLNWRNTICLVRYERNVDEKGFPTKDQLFKDIEAALNLAQRTPANFPNRNQGLFDAQFNFARGCLLLQKKAEGLDHARQALEVPGRSQQEKDAVAAVQRGVGNAEIEAVSGPSL
jgi:serine/threonine protein kinase/tetratricopeptide (TPR) repeat protein